MKDTYFGGSQSKKLVSKITIMKTVPLNLFFCPLSSISRWCRSKGYKNDSEMLVIRAWFSKILVPVLTSSSCLYFLKGPRTVEDALESWMLTVCWSHTLSQGGSHWSHGGSP
jgi:hypothetical protein